MIRTVLLLFLSNVFMTFAWYGHLRDFKDKSLVLVIAMSWGIAFFEYCLQVPANRIGSEYFTLPQLKIIQEIITLCVFVLFSICAWLIVPAWVSTGKPLLLMIWSTF